MPCEFGQFRTLEAAIWGFNPCGYPQLGRLIGEISQTCTVYPVNNDALDVADYKLWAPDGAHVGLCGCTESIEYLRLGPGLGSLPTS